MRGRTPRPGTVPAVSVRGEVDKARIDAREGVIVEAQPLRHPRTVVVNQDVGLFYESQSDRPRLWRLQIETDTFLAGVASRRTHADHHFPKRIAADGFEFDHPRSKVRQRRGTERRCDNGCRFDHGHAFKRPFRRRCRICPVTAAFGSAASYAVGGARLCAEQFGRTGEIDPLRGTADSRRCLHQFRDRAELHSPIDGYNVAVGDDIRIRECGLRRLIGVRRHPTVTNKLLHPLVKTGRLDPPQHSVSEVFEFGRTVAGRTAARCLDTRDGEKVLMQVRQQIAQLDPATILRARAVVVDARHDGHRIRRSFGRWQDAALAQMRHLHAVHVVRQQAAHQRSIEGEATARRPPRVQACKHRRRDPLRCGVGRDLQRRVARTPPTRDAFQAHHPTELGRHHRLNGRIVLVGTVLAKSRHDAVHKIGPRCRQTGVVETEGLPTRPIQRRHHRICGVDDERTQVVQRLGIVEVDFKR